MAMKIKVNINFIMDDEKVTVAVAVAVVVVVVETSEVALVETATVVLFMVCMLLPSTLDVGFFVVAVDFVEFHHLLERNDGQRKLHWTA